MPLFGPPLWLVACLRLIPPARRTRPHLCRLFELTITYVEDDDKRERCKALDRKLGGDAEAMFFGALR